MTPRCSRRRPWLLIGTGSSAPASAVTLVVVVPAILLAAAATTSTTIRHGLLAAGSSTSAQDTYPRRAAQSIPSKFSSVSSITTTCLSSSTRRQESQPSPPDGALWTTLRGGSSDSTDYPIADQNPAPPYGQPASDLYRGTDELYDPEASTQGYYVPDDNAAEQLLHETVQDRVDTWRQAQIAQSSRLQQSPRDDQGRIKLLTGVSRGSRAIIFVCLVFRNLHLFEVADQALGGLARLMVVTPLIGLFVANLAGVVASFTAPTHSSKKRLKAILNLDKLLEVLLIVWNVLRLTVAPSRYVPREVHVSSTLHSLFFILQCQAFTRLTWDENSAVVPSSTATTAATAANANVRSAAPPSYVRREADNFGDDFAADPSDDRWYGNDQRPDRGLDDDNDPNAPPNGD